MRKLLSLFFIVLVLLVSPVHAGIYAGTALCSVYAGDDHSIPKDELSKIISGWHQFTVATTSIFYDRPTCEADLRLQCQSQGEILEVSWKILNYHPEKFISPSATNVRCYLQDEENFNEDPVDLPDGVGSPIQKLLEGWNNNRNFSDHPDPSHYTPKQPIPVPTVEWVMNYIKDNWDKFSVQLILAILGAVTIYIGANAFLAFITAGGSLPSVGATGPLLAAILVAILIKHGALSQVPSHVPTVSVENLSIEIDVDALTFSIEGEIDGKIINKKTVDINELQKIYENIQKRKNLRQAKSFDQNLVK